MATELKSAFGLTAEGVESPSGEWVLRYDDDGYAAVIHTDGRRTWVAPAPGFLRFENTDRLTVTSTSAPGGDLRWDSGPLVVGARFPEGLAQAWVTDSGDVVLVDSRGVPRVGLIAGPLDVVALGPAAPVSAITGGHYLSSSDGRRVVTRTWAGGLGHCRHLGGTAAMRNEYPAASAHRLDQPGADLTWRQGASGRWDLALVRTGDGTVIWSDGDPIHRLPDTGKPMPAAPRQRSPYTTAGIPTTKATPARALRAAKVPAQKAVRAVPARKPAAGETE